MMGIPQPQPRLNMHPAAHTPTCTLAVLHGLLDAQLHLAPEYGNNFTNHLPMALHALFSLGASPERLHNFYRLYVRETDAGIAPEPLQDSGSRLVDWLSLRGHTDAYPALVAHFNARLADSGIEATLRAALPALLPGVAAAAFHGLIRTAHAVEAGHADEIAAALAYWAWRWQPLIAPPLRSEWLEMSHWSAALVAGALRQRTKGVSISSRIHAATQSPLFHELAGALAPSAGVHARIAELAAFSVERYVCTPNFTVLHMITALRALRTLLPWIEDADGLQFALTHTLTHNITAAYLAANVTPTDAAPRAARPDWAQTVAAAIRSDDAHVIKLVHACRAEAAVYGNARYLRAAAIALSAG